MFGEAPQVNDMNSTIRNIFVALICSTLFYTCSDGPTQIDRMGRPAVNMMLIQSFQSDDIRNAAEDNYNATDNAQSVTDFKSVIASNIAVYDSFVDEGGDLHACGDNLITNRTSLGASTALGIDADRYNLLAGIFADDQIYVNSAAGSTCSQYFAVEFTSLGMPFPADCGGRAPNVDVINTSYSILMSGKTTGTDDGVAADSKPAASTFPFLANPI